MFFRKASVFALALGLGVVGCRDNGTLTPADLSMGGGGTGGTGGGVDMAGGGFNTSSISMMRQGAPGNYELDNVIAIAVTPSGSHIFLQDDGGTDFSAIRANCSSTSTAHPCTVQSTVKTVAVGHKVTVQGTYIKSSKAEGGAEEFYISSITDNGAGTLPTPATVMLTDVQQSSVAMATTTAPTNKKYWYQHVTVSNPGSVTVYDLSPTVFKSTSTSCAFQYGFGAAPSGTSGASTATCDASCSTNPAPATCTQPAGVMLNSAEVLIGTDFYNGFTVSSDCKCYSKFSDTIMTPSSASSKLGGILVYDTVYMSNPVQPYLYLAPLDNTNDVHFQ